MKESDIQRLVMLALSEAGCTVWRNNVAKAWVGDKLIWQANGNLTIVNPRVLHAGLCKGSADLIGIAPVVITEQMVGSTVGLFLAPEIKADKGSATPEQGCFMDHVRLKGGIAGICRSPQDALALLAQTKPNE